MDEIRHIEWATYGITVLHPAAVGLTLIMATVVAIGRKQDVGLAFLAVAALIPNSQRLVIATIDFPMIRLIIIVAWLRLFARAEVTRFRLSAMDRALLIWLAFGTLIYSLREGSVEA